MFREVQENSFRIYLASGTFKTNCRDGTLSEYIRWDGFRSNKKSKQSNNVNWFNRFNDLYYAFLYQIYTPDKYFYIYNSYTH